MKRRAPVAALLVTVVCLALLLAGCSEDDLDRANAAMDRANAAVDKANEVDQELTTIMDELAVLEAADQAQAKKALGKLDEAEAKLAQKLKHTQAGIDALEPVMELNVSEDYKTYVRQQIAIAKLQLRSDELGERMFATLRKMYGAGAEGALDEAQLETIGKELDAIFAEGEKIDAQIITQTDESESFFNEKGLE